MGKGREPPDVDSQEDRQQRVALARILELGQQDILVGNHRDLTEFMSELDGEDIESAMSFYLHHRGQGPETVTLECWSIRQFADGARHFVGYSRDSLDGRVSTQIVELNIDGRTARTASGRRYLLMGPSGYNADAEYVWNRVAKVLGGGQVWEDVTEQVAPGSRARRQRYKWPEEEQ
ncbi:hypothetical protein [Burkholderia ubonensis]|uniref:hypothetical protein n=1 Tax=Burkholderia ubonensis TaxID=101571 RepID=UPI00076DA83E|nr:hypothetical protein [Burkholderia ubonensis]KVO06433.1 hypothetical protein WJ71_09510 [Burkholderia ubonensis]